MTRSKPISMKKLYMLATEYIVFKYNQKMDFGKETTDSANKDAAELNRYLRYVWEHRND